MRSAFRQQRGVTLVEVLVSVLILGLALISLAGLQSYTVKYQLGSSQRAVMSVLVSDFAERVRANREGVQLPASPYLFAKSWSDQVADGAVDSDSAHDCQTEDCVDALSLAQWDMAMWRQRVRDELPQGAVSVAGSLNNGLRVTLAWRDNDSEEKSLTCSANDDNHAARNCCPTSLSVPSGVRCANFLILP